MWVMGTAKLLRFFVWRMALLELASGAALGAAYGAALLSIGGLYEEFSTNLPGEVPIGPVQVVVAELLLAGYGAGFGVLIGAPVGLVLGALGGLVVVALTLAAYRSPPPSSPSRATGRSTASPIPPWSSSGACFPSRRSRANGAVPTASGSWGSSPRWRPCSPCGGPAGE